MSIFNLDKHYMEHIKHDHKRNTSVEVNDW